MILNKLANLSRYEYGKEITLLNKDSYWDFPGGPVVKNLPSNAGNVCLIPGWGIKMPHAAGQLSPHTATTEPARSGAHVPQLERSPRSATKRSRAATKDPACRN